MAIDNLNFYSNWLPAGQLTDKYSSQPWCLRSRNLDIFSSSKSVKATAWSVPTTTWADIIKQDGDLILKTDWKVYELVDGVETLFIDPSTNFPVYDVSYEWWWGWTYAPATRWTVQDMSVKYEWDEWRSFVVFTDRASFVYSKQKFIFNKEFTDITNLSYSDTGQPYSDGYLFTKPTASQKAFVSVKIPNAPFSKTKIRIYAEEYAGDDANISLNKVSLLESDKFYYDAKTDWIIPYWTDGSDLTFSGDITVNNWIEIEIPVSPRYTWYTYVTLEFLFTPKVSSYVWSSWKLYIDIDGWPVASHMMKKADGTTSDWDSNYYYTYLPIRDRKLVDVWAYAYSSSYWIKWVSFQPLYKWSSSRIEDGLWNYKIIYDFIADMWWESDVSMDVIWMVVWNEQVYMIWNMNWDWYIIPCDLSWGRGTPYIAYGCEFKWAANIDYLMYLVWADRGISKLWVYNGQELVAILGGNEEKDKKNLIKTDEQYRFDWRMVEYRDNLILTTEDNRVFAYGQTYGGKWGTFIHELPWAITGLRVKGNDLIVNYTQNTTEYVTILQDDLPIRRYNTEWMAEYPIILWNHLLEKEESDLFASYILPSASTSLEFWGMANHYHFWTFTSSDTYQFSATANYKMKWATWNYNLKYIETNGNQYTFRLEGDLPVQSTSDMQIIDSEWNVLINYSDFNHFRKIWEITTDKYWEWEFRFTNLNNKLELPASHSLQIMVKGKGTASYTPELFALDLVANQREKW